MEKDEDLDRSRRVSTTFENVRHVDSTNLLRGSRCLVIEHAGQNYCLRLTRNERLILTKI